MRAYIVTVDLGASQPNYTALRALMRQYGFEGHSLPTVTPPQFSIWSQSPLAEVKQLVQRVISEKLQADGFSVDGFEIERMDVE